MNAELDIYGVFMPGLLGMMIIAWLVMVVVKWVLEKKPVSTSWFGIARSLIWLCT